MFLDVYDSVLEDTAVRLKSCRPFAHPEAQLPNENQLELPEMKLDAKLDTKLVNKFAIPFEIVSWLMSERLFAFPVGWVQRLQEA